VQTSGTEQVKPGVSEQSRLIIMLPLPSSLNCTPQRTTLSVASTESDRKPSICNPNQALVAKDSEGKLVK
jgi:hypothetical protein